MIISFPLWNQQLSFLSYMEMLLHDTEPAAQAKKNPNSGVNSISYFKRILSESAVIKIVEHFGPDWSTTHLLTIFFTFLETFQPHLRRDSMIYPPGSWIYVTKLTKELTFSQHLNEFWNLK